MNLLNDLRVFMAFDKQNESMLSEYFEIITTNGIKKCDLIERSNAVVFFLTNKFIESDEFRESWSKRKDKAILIVLLEQIKSSTLEFLDLDLNQFFVFNFNNLMSLTEKEESIRRFQTLLFRLVNLKKVGVEEIPMVKSGQLKYKFSNKSSKCRENGVKETIKKIELIDKNKIIVQDVKDTIIDWKRAKTMTRMDCRKGNFTKQEFCWINHMELLFCVREESEDYKSKCLLITIKGKIIECVFSFEKLLYQINSVSYNKNNYEIYLNVFNRVDLESSILILNPEFKLIKTIQMKDLANPDFPVNYVSEIELLNVQYKMFHYNSNIAFLQKKNYDYEFIYVQGDLPTYYNDWEKYNKEEKNVYVFDKSSYSIIRVIEEVDRLLMVSADRFLFFMSQPEKQRDNVYIIQNIQLNKSTPPDSNAYCKFKNNPLASYHLLSNPFLLPCGCLGCLKCILHHYNLFKQTFKCENCKQEYRLPQQLEPLNKTIMSGLFNEDFFKTILEKNNNITFEIGNHFFKEYSSPKLPLLYLMNILIL